MKNDIIPKAPAVVTEDVIMRNLSGVSYRDALLILARVERQLSEKAANHKPKRTRQK